MPRTIAELLAEHERMKREREYYQRLGMFQGKGSQASPAPMPPLPSFPPARPPVGNALAGQIGAPPPQFGGYTLGQQMDGRVNRPWMERQVSQPIGGNMPDHTSTGNRDGERETLEELIARTRHLRGKR